MLREMLKLKRGLLPISYIQYVLIYEHTGNLDFLVSLALKRVLIVNFRLRKDLKRYKVLLADAQTMIDHLKSDAINKQQLKQLKSQV